MAFKQLMQVPTFKGMYPDLRDTIIPNDGFKMLRGYIPDRTKRIVPAGKIGQTTIPVLGYPALKPGSGIHVDSEWRVFVGSLDNGTKKVHVYSSGWDSIDGTPISLGTDTDDTDLSYVTVEGMTRIYNSDVENVGKVFGYVDKTNWFGMDDDIDWGDGLKSKYVAECFNPFFKDEGIFGLQWKSPDFCMKDDDLYSTEEVVEGIINFHIKAIEDIDNGNIDFTKVKYKLYVSWIYDKYQYTFPDKIKTITADTEHGTIQFQGWIGYPSVSWPVRMTGFAIFFRRYDVTLDSDATQDDTYYLLDQWNFEADTDNGEAETLFTDDLGVHYSDGYKYITNLLDENKIMYSESYLQTDGKLYGKGITYYEELVQTESFEAVAGYKPSELLIKVGCKDAVYINGRVILVNVVETLPLVGYRPSVYPDQLVYTKSYPKRLRYSNVNQLDTFPVNNYIDFNLNGDLVAVGSYREKVVIISTEETILFNMDGPESQWEELDRINIGVQDKRRVLFTEFGVVLKTSTGKIYLYTGELTTISEGIIEKTLDDYQYMMLGLVDNDKLLVYQHTAENDTTAFLYDFRTHEWGSIVRAIYGHENLSNIAYKALTDKNYVVSSDGSQQVIKEVELYVIPNTDEMQESYIETKAFSFSDTVESKWYEIRVQYACSGGEFKLYYKIDENVNWTELGDLPGTDNQSAFKKFTLNKKTARKITFKIAPSGDGEYFELQALGILGRPKLVSGEVV